MKALSLPKPSPKALRRRRAGGLGFVVLVIALISLDPSHLWAKGSDISGKVTVLDQGHHPLSDFSNAVVFIDTINGNKGFTPPAENPVMASQDMSFVPSLLPILVGTTVSFPNKDNMLHNVFSLSKAKTFDLGLYRQGQEKSVTFDEPGLVKVYCNLHPRMVGYILVLGNPYFTLTDKEGRFTLKDVPNGTYTLVCWYQGGKAGREMIVTKDRTVTVASSSTSGAPVDFELVTGKGSSGHKNKWGKDYQDKY